MTELTGRTFDSEVGKAAVAMVKFYLPGCAPCRSLDASLRSWGGRGRVSMFGVNIEDQPDLVNRFGVMSAPTLIVFRRGEEVTRAFGSQQASALDALVK